MTATTEIEAAGAVLTIDNNSVGAAADDLEDFSMRTVSKVSVADTGEQIWPSPHSRVTETLWGLESSPISLKHSDLIWEGRPLR